MNKIPYDRNCAVDFLNEHFRHDFAGERGEERDMKCPFCRGGQSGEVSFNVNMKTGACRCWRAKCGWRGSFVYFVKSYLDCDWATAYAISAGAPPEDIDTLVALLNKLGIKEKEEYNFVDPTVNAWIQSAVPVEQSDSLDDVCEWLESVRGYNPDEFIDRHPLFIAQHLLRYENRVIFQITTNDRLAYLAYSMEPGARRKTLNPPGNMLSNMFFNYDEVKTRKTVFLVEGIFDAARLISWDVGAICCFGLNLSDEQVFLLSELDAEELVICFDNGCDHLAKGLIKRLWGMMDKKLSFISIPTQGVDPDDLTEEEFLRLYSKRVKFLANDKDKVDNLLLGF